MAALKAHEVDRFIAKPDEAFGLILLYGPDHGLTSERSQALFRAFGAKTDDPFSFISLDGDVVASDSSRLLDEAATQCMFGGRRFIRLRLGSRPVHSAVQGLLAAGPMQALTIIEAGDLKKGAPLRKLVEEARSAMALPCYQDSKQQLGKLIDEELATSGQTMEAEARHLLIRSLGGDREASRAEIRKLCLYAAKSKTITPADVAAICGDASAFAMSGLIDAVFAGQVSEIELLMRRTDMEDVSAQAVLAAALRHAAALHRASLMVAQNLSRDQALRQVDPGGSFTRKGLIEVQLRAWTPDMALWAMEKIGDAVADSRMMARMDMVIAHRLFIVLAERARRARA